MEQATPTGLGPHGAQPPDLAVRDLGPYSARNSSKGALTVEAVRVFTAFLDCPSLLLLRQKALEGSLLSQPARSTRARIWDSLYQRYLAHSPQWLLADLARAATHGPRDPRLLALLYLHYAVRDRLVFDFVTNDLYERWTAQRLQVVPGDLRSRLDRASAAQTQIERWSESSRERLSQSVLAALRDFGLLEGVARKRLVQPPLPLDAAEHLVRFLTAEGRCGREVIEAPDWRLFLRNETEVLDLLTRLSLEKRIGFERAGSTVVLHTPEEWSAS